MRPGKAHNRLTPSNCDQLLFDDVLWVERAKRDHFDFMTKMREQGVDVVEMHNLLAETLALPDAKNGFWINKSFPMKSLSGLLMKRAVFWMD